MKRAIGAVVGAVVVAVVLLFLLLGERTGSNELVLDEQLLATPSAAEPAAVSPTHPLPPDGARPARITRLADGDSFDIEWSDSGDTDELRLLGINAPETTACFGDASRGVLDLLTTDRELLVETVARDEFGRGLAHVWAGGVFINARLVELGAAIALSDGGDHVQLLVDAQQVANENETGLWDPTFCGSTSESAVRIATIEGDAPGQDHLFPNGEWIELVNDGATAADLSGWSIRDESTRNRYDFPDGFSLEPGATVRVYSGCGDDDVQSLYWCGGGPVWNNGGDTGFLVDPEGRFADTLSYPGE